MHANRGNHFKFSIVGLPLMLSTAACPSAHRPVRPTFRPLSQLAGATAGAIPAQTLGDQPAAETQGLDQVRFGQIPNATFVIPPHSLVVTVPGMCGPKSSVEPLRDYLQSKGHDAHAIRVPGILTAQDTKDSSRWLADKLDSLRIGKAQQQLFLLRNLLGTTHPMLAPQQRLQLIRFLGLSDTPQGHAVANTLITTLGKPEHPILKRIDELDPKHPVRHGKPKPRHQQLAPQLDALRQELTQVLKPSFQQATGATAATHAPALEKTVNHILDQLAPRVVLVGHSLGGFVGNRVLLDSQANHIGMVLSLGSPLNGINLFRITDNHVPQRLAHSMHRFEDQLQRLWPALAQMRAGSREVQDIQNAPQPFDTTSISIANPQDELVQPHEARFQPQQPGRLQILVQPLESTMRRLLDPMHRALLRLMEVNPFVYLSRRLVTDSQTFSGIRHHCGLVEHFDTYWPQDGDMIRQVMIPERLSRLLDQTHYEPMRYRVLELLHDRLQEHPEEAEQYRPLQGQLAAISQQQALPLSNDTAEKAQAVLNQIRGAATRNPTTTQTP